MESISKKHTACRVCGNEHLIPYLDLGMIPLANNLCQSKKDAINSERFELKVAFCENCGLSQLTEVVNPEVLFSYYTYRSSVNQGYIDHCREMAKELKRKYELNENSYHIDIAGNDGTLLLEFEKVLNHRVLNVDPAVNLCHISQSRGIPTIAEFWDMDVANFTRNTADLITATNVFAHLDNVTEFLECCKIALKDNGVIVIENPYWPITMAGNQFDQVYFEHVSYWSLDPMIKLCEKVGLHLVDFSGHMIHGGSYRYEIRKHPNSYFGFMSGEVENLNLEYLQNWGNSIKSIRDGIVNGLSNLKGSIVGFAASAKGNTLLNYCGIDHTILDFICDETPEKIGKFSPGTGIEIKGLEAIIEAQPNYILILSWNFQTEIINKLRPLCPNSKYIIPIPEFQIIE
jgi:SAM-dependent methyltransferase